MKKQGQKLKQRRSKLNGLNYVLFFGMLFLINIFSNVNAQQLAFPTAEGHGAYSKGGRGGDVYIVKSLGDNSNNPQEGTLRHALETQNGARTIVFEIGGVIELEDHLVTDEDRLTIAGQTAPGDGICITNYSLKINHSDIIVRHIRSRLGQDGEQSDAISIEEGHNIIIDHCSASWAIDEVLSTSTGKKDALGNVTVQWCIISEALNTGHKKANHSFGALIRGCYGAKYSYLYNLFANNRSRNPRPGNYGSNDYTKDADGLLFDFRNNVLYNWKNDFPGYDSDTISKCRFNYINNYGKPGPESDLDVYAYYARSHHFRAYFSGNYFGGEIPLNQKDLVKWNNETHIKLDGNESKPWTSSEKDDFFTTSPFDQGVIPKDGILSAEDAYNAVVNYAGAGGSAAGTQYIHRDEVDERVIGHVTSGTSARGTQGAIIDVIGDVYSSFPYYSSGSAAADSDNDGMPDWWEDGANLNHNDDQDGDGYTNLEEYLNFIAGDEGGCKTNIIKHGSGSKPRK